METLTIFVLLIAISTSGFCPNSNFKGNVISGNVLSYVGQLIAAYNGGIIPLSEESETKCYDYVFSYPFSNEVDVAISVHDFETEYSEDLYFFIKPIEDEQKDSKTVLTLAIRTQWKYTRWTQISFSFLAEDHTDIETGYYQLDSGSLSGCHSSQTVQILLPFTNPFQSGQQIVHKAFLHGF